MYKFKKIDYQKLIDAKRILSNLSMKQFTKNIKFIYDVLKKKDLYNYILCQNKDIKYLNRENLTNEEEVVNLIYSIYKDELASFSYFPLLRNKYFDDNYIIEIPLTYVLDGLDSVKRDLIGAEIAKSGSSLEKLITLKRADFSYEVRKQIEDNFLNSPLNSGLAMIFNIGDFKTNYKMFTSIPSYKERAMVESIIQALYGIRLDQIDYYLNDNNTTIKRLNNPSDVGEIKESIRVYQANMTKKSNDKEL